MNLEEEIAQVAHAYTCGCPDGDNPGATATAIAAEIMPLVKHAQAEALREAATEAYPNLGTEAFVLTSTYSVRKWLNKRADRIESEVPGV